MINLYRNILRSRYVSRVNSELPDLLSLLIMSLKAGVSLPKALEVASVELSEPIRSELAVVVAQLKLGSTMEEALSVFVKRVPTDDVALIVQSAEILRRTGGNLVQTFELLAETIEERRKVEKKIRVLTSQGIYQGIMLLAMPWFLGGALSVIAPEYIDPLLNTKLGIVFVLMGILLEVLGALWLWKIVVIRV